MGDIPSTKTNSLNAHIFLSKDSSTFSAPNVANDSPLCISQANSSCLELILYLQLWRAHGVMLLTISFLELLGSLWTSPQSFHVSLMLLHSTEICLRALTRPNSWFLHFPSLPIYMLQAPTGILSTFNCQRKAWIFLVLVSFDIKMIALFVNQVQIWKTLFPMSIALTPIA